MHVLVVALLAARAAAQFATSVVAQPFPTPSHQAWVGCQPNQPCVVANSSIAGYCRGNHQPTGTFVGYCRPGFAPCGADGAECADNEGVGVCAANRCVLREQTCDAARTSANGPCVVGGAPGRCRFADDVFSLWCSVTVNASSRTGVPPGFPPLPPLPPGVPVPMFPSEAWCDQSQLPDSFAVCEAHKERDGCEEAYFEGGQRGGACTRLGRAGTCELDCRTPDSNGLMSCPEIANPLNPTREETSKVCELTVGKPWGRWKSVEECVDMIIQSCERNSDPNCVFRYANIYPNSRCTIADETSCAAENDLCVESGVFGFCRKQDDGGSEQLECFTRADLCPTGERCDVQTGAAYADTPPELGPLDRHASCSDNFHCSTTTTSCDADDEGTDCFQDGFAGKCNAAQECIRNPIACGPDVDVCVAGGQQGTCGVPYEVRQTLCAKDDDRKRQMFPGDGQCDFEAFHGPGGCYDKFKQCHNRPLSDAERCACAQELVQCAEQFNCEDFQRDAQNNCRNGGGPGCDCDPKPDPECQAKLEDVEAVCRATSGCRKDGGTCIESGFEGKCAEACVIHGPTGPISFECIDRTQETMPASEANAIYARFCAVWSSFGEQFGQRRECEDPNFFRNVCGTANNVPTHCVFRYLNYDQQLTCMRNEVTCDTVGDFCIENGASGVCRTVDGGGLACFDASDRCPAGDDCVINGAEFERNNGGVEPPPDVEFVGQCSSTFQCIPKSDRCSRADQETCFENGAKGTCTSASVAQDRELEKCLARVSGDRKRTAYYPFPPQTVTGIIPATPRPGTADDGSSQTAQQCFDRFGTCFTYCEVAGQVCGPTSRCAFADSDDGESFTSGCFDLGENAPKAPPKRDDRFELITIRERSNRGPSNDAQALLREYKLDGKLEWWCCDHQSNSLTTAIVLRRGAVLSYAEHLEVRDLAESIAALNGVDEAELNLGELLASDLDTLSETDAATNALLSMWVFDDKKIDADGAEAFVKATFDAKVDPEQLLVNLVVAVDEDAGTITVRVFASQQTKSIPENVQAQINDAHLLLENHRALVDHEVTFPIVAVVTSPPRNPASTISFASSVVLAAVVCVW